MCEEAVLELQNIEKTYNGRTVLNNISLRVFAGECITLTGENGCGKSTLLRVAAGLSLPNKGRIVRRVRGSVQYVPDDFPSIHMTGGRFLQLMKRVDCEADEHLIRAFHMDAYLNESISCYSKGMRSKISVLQALLAKPKLLLMDEPVSGQDGDSRETFMQVVKERMKSGCAVLMACHELELVNELSSHVYRIVNGELVPGNWLCKPDEAACLCGECALLASGSCAGRGMRHA